MANHDGNMESSRALALADRLKVDRLYKPPGIHKMRYRIIDTQTHANYSYRTKKKYQLNVKRFSREINSESRFIFIDSK